jgi:hypothetical protein
LTRTRHLEILKKLDAAWKSIDAAKAEAEKANSLSAFKEVTAESARIFKYSEPYVVAQKQSEALKGQGYLVKGWEGQVCNGPNCSSVDPMTALFMILAGALADELNKDRPFDPESNDLIKFLMQPAGGEKSTFVQLRSLIIPQHDQGEFAKLLRDPVKRPIEIIQNWRDAVIPKDDTGEGAKIIRDPVKCTVGRLFGQCN